MDVRIVRAARKYRETQLNIQMAQTRSGEDFGVGAVLTTLARIYSEER